MVLFVSFQDLVYAWNYVFFTPQSTLTLCIFRVLVGFLMVEESLQWFLNHQKHLSVAGYFNFHTFKAAVHKKRFSLIGYLPRNDTSVQLMIAMQLVAAIFLACGLLPQVAALICFISSVSIHNRNPFVTDSGDTVRRYFCLLLIFAPSNTQLLFFSSDILIRPEEQAWPWTLILIQFFMANIYMKNVLFKLLGSSWRNGTATKRIFDIRIWNRFALPALLNRNWFYRASSYGALIIESLLFSFIWINECRLFIVTSGIIFHLVLWLFLRLGHFQLTMICGLLCFVKPEEYLALMVWLGIY
jgi:uncharacterized membrane protein YphA (DoxX/SURF4 family)